MNTSHDSQEIANELLLQYNLIDPSPLLRLAISEDSNRVTDWLWYAGLVDSDAERCYCYERARYIDPKDAAARQGVEDLNKKQTALANSAYPVAPYHAKLLQEWMRTHIFRTPDADI